MPAVACRLFLEVVLQMIDLPKNDSRMLQKFLPRRRQLHAATILVEQPRVGLIFQRLYPYADGGQ